MKEHLKHKIIPFPAMMSLLFSVILYPAIKFVTILLKARHEELIFWRIYECSFLLRAIYKVLQMKRKRQMRRCASKSELGIEPGSSRLVSKCANHSIMPHSQKPFYCQTYVYQNVPLNICYPPVPSSNPGIKKIYKGNMMPPNKKIYCVAKRNSNFKQYLIHRCLKNCLQTLKNEKCFFSFHLGSRL